MSFKRRVLSALGKDLLLEIGRGLELDVTTRMGVKELRDALMKVDPEMERTFYEIEAERDHWQVAHLERQIHTHLHLRLLKSRNKAA